MTSHCLPQDHVQTTGRSGFYPNLQNQQENLASENVQGGLGPGTESLPHFELNTYFWVERIDLSLGSQETSLCEILIKASFNPFGTRQDRNNTCEDGGCQRWGREGVRGFHVQQTSTGCLTCTRLGGCQEEQRTLPGEGSWGGQCKETPGQRCSEGGMSGLLGSVTAPLLQCPQTWPIFKDQQGFPGGPREDAAVVGTALEEGGTLGCRSGR